VRVFGIACFRWVGCRFVEVTCVPSAQEMEDRERGRELCRPTDDKKDKSRANDGETFMFVDVFMNGCQCRYCFTLSTMHYS